jgi:hypothetical protein
MKSNALVSVLSLISGAVLLALPCGAQDLVYETTQAAAIARANYEGKMILTDFGRPDCSDCSGMESRFQGIAPPLKQWILASCVLWTADIDTSTEWQPYASGLGSFGLPLMCFVDPAKPGTWTARYNGLIAASTFLVYIQSQAIQNLPLVVDNLPGVPLTNLVNGSFIVNGLARTNAAFSGSISNAAITAVMWRLNGTGPFQAAIGTTVWSAPVTLPSGTNTFESYVQYEGARNSWTNRVTLMTVNKAVLTVTHSGNSVIISWPSASTGFVLQQNSNLATTNWTTRSGISDDGTNKSITITSLTGNLFFRLSHP